VRGALLAPSRSSGRAIKLFAECEEFVALHRAWGTLASDVGEITERGYSVSSPAPAARRLSGG